MNYRLGNVNNIELLSLMVTLTAIILLGQGPQFNCHFSQFLTGRTGLEMESEVFVTLLHLLEMFKPLHLFPGI